MSANAQNPMVQPGADMNSAIRSRGDRLRNVRIPEIGQSGPLVPQAMPERMPPSMMSGGGPPIGGPPPMPAGTPPMGGPPPMAAPRPTGSPMAAPRPMAAPTPFSIHPPGTPADPSHYNYEPQPDGAWKVYPPGVNAPAGTYQASLPKAASTADYTRMSRELSRMMGR